MTRLSHHRHRLISSGWRILLCYLGMPLLWAQYGFNHPELEWLTCETAHFKVHYHAEAEWTARRSAEIAEAIYEPITSFYDFRPTEKTHLIIRDTDDYSNGAAYYYDNKILIWATPLDFPLRGNHDWLRDVITHEFAHIVSLGKSMKLSRRIPAAYLQVIDYEDEKRDDVVYGYPRVLVSYPLPALVIPMWLAEGMAQYMYPDATNDFWDTHRDMILRDRVINRNLLSLSEMGSFGRRGLGNEAVYNQGYAFVDYLTREYGVDIMPRLAREMAQPQRFSIETALRRVTGQSARQLYTTWRTALEAKYEQRLQLIRTNAAEGDVVIDEAVNQMYPVWARDSLIYFLSNKGMDHFSQTSLYTHSLRTGKSQLLIPEVRSRISFAPDRRAIYYSKKSKPNRHGSIYFDIFRYDLETRKETQVTRWQRAYNPAVAPDGASMVFITGSDGTSNIARVNLDRSAPAGPPTPITRFNNGEQVFSVVFGPDGHWLAFDYLSGHGRDLALIDYQTGVVQLLDGEKHDTRDPCFSPDGQWLYYASDETGIFNIYRRSLDDHRIEMLTNVTGGAFTPSVNDRGELLFVAFQNNRFVINRLGSCHPVAPQLAIYSDYPETSTRIMPLAQLPACTPASYHDQFAKMFILPRMMLDYGTVKPGFYFFSSEIIERFNILGGASLNAIRDRDLFVLLEYHQWSPTIYIELYNISRNILDQQLIWRSRPVSLDYTFYLTEFVLGLSHPVDMYNQFRLDAVYSRYRTSSNERIPSEGIYQNGFTYSYYKGWNYRLNWLRRRIKPGVNEDTNPGPGYTLTTTLTRSYDRFMREFGIYEDFGTLKEIYRDNFYWKIEHEGHQYHRIAGFSRLSGDFKWRTGWISKPRLDSFFNFFAGGMPGLRGYPFYSLEGRNLMSLHYTLRWPLFREKDYPLGMFHLQNVFLAAYAETGNAWTTIPGYTHITFRKWLAQPYAISRTAFRQFKSDIGLQLQLSGFSFYAYPTAISLDWVYGLNRFELTDRQHNRHSYGREWRTYLTILFGL